MTIEGFATKNLLMDLESFACDATNVQAHQKNYFYF